MALSTLWAYELSWEPHLTPVKHLSSIELKALENQLEKGFNTPMTSSMGRLFDAVSALIGIRQEISYEAQAAMELEAIVNPAELGYYPVQIIGENIDIKPMLQSILQDIAQKEAPSNIAARFHNTIANLSLELAVRIRQSFQINQIALSGGVWQNMVLLKKTIILLESKGFDVLIHKITPPNDGCVALGQAIITAYKVLYDKE
jgi:hydrogenase maturation protein HypF